jgi:TonB family protein
MIFHNQSVTVRMAVLAVLFSACLAGCVVCPNKKAEVGPYRDKDPFQAAFFGLIRDEFRYPHESCMANHQGDVVLHFDQLPTGEIQNVRLVRSSGYALLDQEAIRVVKTIETRRIRLPRAPGFEADEKTIVIEVPIGFRTRR